MEKTYLDNRYFDYNNEKLYTIKDLNIIFKNNNYKPLNKKKKELYFECCLLLKKIEAKSIIQKYWRKYFITIYNKISGPAIIKRNICNNVEEFLTLDSVYNINYYDFISFKDKDGFIYGFSIHSLKILLKDNILKNPYNRNVISSSINHFIQKKYKFNKIMNVTENKPINPRPDLITFFQTMDEFGNITMVQWLTDLTPKLLKKFILELHDIWNYRAGLSIIDKKKLCPPQGNPFINIPITSILDKKYKPTNDILYQYIHSIFYLLLHNHYSTIECKKICSIHILLALTIVSENAANALPWLYNSTII